jgi:hypothetical protein
LRFAILEKAPSGALAQRDEQQRLEKPWLTSPVP